MSEMSFEEAASALKEAAATEFAEEPAETAPEQAEEPTLDVEPGTPEESDSDWNLDINTLPEDLKPLAKSLQGDYTRKARALAEQRKLYEEYGDPDSVAQAVALARAFDSDPTGTFERVQHALIEQGLLQSGTPQQIAEPAAIEDPVLANIAAQYGTNDPLYQLAAALREDQHSLKSEREMFAQEKAAAEQARSDLEYEQYYTQTTAAIRADHPEWDDTDLEAVENYAFSTGGDLVQAAGLYDEYQNRAVSRWIQKKGVASSGSGSLGSAHSGQQPPAAPKSLEEARRQAEEELRALIGAGEFGFGQDD